MGVSAFAQVFGTNKVVGHSTEIDSIEIEIE